jgi:hypothetical protein
MCALMFKTPIAPMGKCLADMPNLTLAVLLGSNLVLQGKCTCQPRLQNAIARMEKLLTCLLENFPSPPWETHVCSLLAGRRCPCHFWHRHDNNFLDLREREHSERSTC